MPLPRGKEAFKDDKTLFVTEREFLRERTAYHSREIYRIAFDFMSQFVLTIEVMPDEHRFIYMYMYIYINICVYIHIHM